MIGDAVRALPARWRKLAEGFRNGTDIGNAEAACLGVSAAELDAALCPTRNREADRARFPDKAFNSWLDMGISDGGHTVWDAVGDIYAAWDGWQACKFSHLPIGPFPWDFGLAATDDVEPPRRAMILRNHEDRGRLRVVLLRRDQTEEMDADPKRRPREWLTPFIGWDWHLLAFVDVEVQE